MNVLNKFITLHYTSGHIIIMSEIILIYILARLISKNLDNSNNENLKQNDSGKQVTIVEEIQSFFEDDNFVPVTSFGYILKNEYTKYKDKAS